MATKTGIAIACGPSRQYYAGDPRPPRSAGYGEFIEWQEAQLRNRKRKPEQKRSGKSS